MASTSDFRNGLVLDHKSGLWKIIEFLHVKPGKGPAFVRTKLKDISSGKIIKMHDPTEGGISTAIHELCEFSNVGCEIDINAINFVSNFKEVCETLNINPLGVISSGCLLMICEEKDSLSIVNKLNLSGINGKIIGKTTKSLNRNIIKTDGSKEKLERFDQDEIIKIFE